MYCVIVGDIVNSRQLEPEVREAATRAAKRVFDRINGEYAKSLMTTFGMVRGDAFEGVILTQSYAPRIVEDIIKAFYSAEGTKVRVSVVLGQLTVTGSDRNEVDGPAFHQAWGCLEDMKQKDKKGHWLQVSFTIGSLAQKLVDSQIALLEALTWGWTERQREIVWATQASGGVLKSVAEELGISVSAVRKHLEAANYDAYCGAWDGLVDYLEQMDRYATDKEKAVIEESYVPYYNTAMRKHEQRNHPEALRLMEQALERAKKSLGEKDQLLIQIYNYLADIYLCLELREKAEGAVEMSLRLQENMPKTRLEYVEALYLKAGLQRRKENLEEARESYEEALEIAKHTLEANHAMFGVLYNEIANTYEAQEKYAEAIESYEVVRAMDKETERDPVNCAATEYNIALCYYKMEDYGQALPRVKEALSAWEEHLPLGHEDITDAKKLMIAIKIKQGGTPS